MKRLASPLRSRYCPEVMRRDVRSGSDAEKDAVGPAERERAPGKGALTDRLVQRSVRQPPSSTTEVEPRAAAAPVLDPFDWRALIASEVQFAGQGADPSVVRDAAASGVATPVTTLPHLDTLTRTFGPEHDLGDVRAHVGGAAEESARSMGAQAYATGSDVVLPASPSLHLVAHEVAHVVQQRAGVQLAGGVGTAGDPYERQADGVADAVVAGEHVGHRLGGGSPVVGDNVQLSPGDGPPVDAGLPAGVVDAYNLQPAAELPDEQLGGEHTRAEELARSGNIFRIQEIEDEIEKRMPGLALEGSTSPTSPGNTRVTPDVALQILDNVSRGEPPFKPELGKGGASWFVTEGNPYTGVSPDKSVNVDVEIAKPAKPVVLGEKDLVALLETQLRATAAESEAAFRQRFGLDASAPLNARMRKALTRFQQQFAESRMWDAVAAKVKSSGGVGEVVLESGSRFSRSGSGKFAVVTDAAKVSVKGGAEALAAALEQAGLSAEPPILEAAQKLANKMRWGGRVRGVFRHGGRVLIVVAIAGDFWKVFRADNKPKAIIESAGGWAGATAGAAAFAAWFTPADTAGPLAWAAHGVGTLLAGGIGYWVGSESTRTVYELVAD